MSPRSRHHRGFSLVELLVSISIISVILTVVVLSQQTYTERAALANVADELGLNIAKAQAYGIAVRELTPGSENFSAPYGLSLSLLGSGSKGDYLFFADRNANDYYDGDWTCQTGGAFECLEKVVLSRGNYIDSLCVVRTTGSDQCNTAYRVDISFVRPDTVARLTFFNNGGQVFSPANVKGAKIVLKSPGGSERTILIYETGQISVQ